MEDSDSCWARRFLFLISIGSEAREIYWRTLFKTSKGRRALTTSPEALDYCQVHAALRFAGWVRVCYIFKFGCRPGSVLSGPVCIGRRVDGGSVLSGVLRIQ